MRVRWDLGIKKLLPAWREIFSTRYLREDLVAGLTVACIAAPLSLAIAMASDVRPEVGLVTAIVAGIVCAFFGGTPLAVSGPAAALTIFVASNFERFGISGILFIGCITGLLQILTGVLGFGSVMRFLPAPVVAGFTAGIGIILIVGQLPRAFGVPAPDQAHVFQVIEHLGQLMGDANVTVLLVTLFSIGFMRYLPRVFPRIPGPLAAVLVPSLVVWIFGLEVPLLGEIPRTLPVPTIPMLPDSWKDLIAASLIVYVIASMETLLSSSAVDRLSKGKRHDPDQELIGQGLGNIAVSCFGGIPVTAVIARSALNVQSGAKTRRAAIIHSLAVLATVFLFSSLVGRIPVPALAGVLLSVALNMVSYREFKLVFHSSRADAAVYLVTLLCVVFADLLIGVQAGVGMAFLMAALRLGQTRIQEHRDVGGMVGYSLSGTLTFLSVKKLDRLKATLETTDPSTGVTLDVSRLIYVDSTGATLLLEIVESLRKRGNRVALKGMTRAVEDPIFAADEGGEVRESMAVTENEVAARVGGDKLGAARARLLSGVDRFQSESKGRYEMIYGRLAKEQNPHTLFIACADSRVTPQLVTSSDPGELFEARNVGNYVPPFGSDGTPAEGAAIEYGVGVLGVSQIIVCGHSGCGAIRACLSNQDLTGLPSVSRWLGGIKGELKGKKLPETTVEEGAKLNVLQQLEHVKTYPLVKERLANGTLRLCGWFFDVGIGELFEYSNSRKEFVRIASQEHQTMEKGATVSSIA